MLNGYPRPQLERKEWLNLNGEWQFLFDDEKRGEKEKWYEHFPEETGRIQVPYTYETKYSGMGEEKFHPVVWYHREIEIDRVENRRLLHFEGIDYIAKVWVNGQFVGMHTGGYARFTIDISDYIVPGKNSITVRAEDSMSCVQPRGKQLLESRKLRVLVCADNRNLENSLDGGSSGYLSGTRETYTGY